jgi:hypothetical protein
MAELGLNAPKGGAVGLIRIFAKTNGQRKRRTSFYD